MFEEEAKEFKKQIQQEYLDLGKNGAYPPLWERIGELWEKGAEFGYNKANEWHYIKGGDFPPEDSKVLALMADKEICIAHFYRINVWDKIGTVIAWKEIVLPKEAKNEL